MGVTGLLLPVRKSGQLEMTWWLEVLGAMLNYGVKTSLQADGAVRKARMTHKSGRFQCNWRVACVVIEVISPGD